MIQIPHWLYVGAIVHHMGFPLTVIKVTHNEHNGWYLTYRWRGGEGCYHSSNLDESRGR